MKIDPNVRAHQSPADSISDNDDSLLSVQLEDSVLDMFVHVCVLSESHQRRDGTKNVKLPQSFIQIQIVYPSKHMIAS